MCVGETKNLGAALLFLLVMICTVAPAATPDPWSPEGGLVVYFPMDSDPGWTTEGQWEFGIPKGGGGPQSYDPDSGYTGHNVYGYNLAGNYGNNEPEYCLTTTPLDCSLAENVILTFWRWLGVEMSVFDQARIQVSNDGANWTELWTNGAEDTKDSSWVYCEYDISAVADRQPTVYIRWCMGPTDSSGTYAGWNIDDVCLRGDVYDALFVSPNDVFVSSGPEGGPFAPAYKGYTLTNEGSSELHWTAEATQTWLQVTPSEGVLPPDSNVVVELGIGADANSLLCGDYTDTVVFTNTTTGYTRSIDVGLYVSAERKIYVPADFNNIQAAIDSAFDGDTIVVLDGTYTGDGNRDIDFKGKAITLRSQNGPENCVIDAAGSLSSPHRGFYFHSGETCESIVDGFTITGGNGCSRGGAIYCSSSSPTIRNCVITDNTAHGWENEIDEVGLGGGLYCSDASPEIVDCIIGENGAKSGGGVYCSADSFAVLENCTITKNELLDPGWDYEAAGICNLGNLTLANCTFSHHGNAMYNKGATVSLQNCTFFENADGSDIGGGAICNQDSDLSLVDCVLRGNNGGIIGGGAIRSIGSDLVLRNCIFSGNEGVVGGAMYNQSSNLTLANCILAGNQAAAGGAIYNDRSKPTLINCTFSGNKGWPGPGGGAGAMNNVNSNPTLVNCILWGDWPDEIYAGTGTPVVTYCDVQGGWPGEGNIDADPSFADPNKGDYHLKSQAGRYDPKGQNWVQDDMTSPCIDAGSLTNPIGLEPFPNWGVVNMGAYGGTAQASKSYFGQPVCEKIVAGDINGDCKVDFSDFVLMAAHWLERN